MTSRRYFAHFVLFGGFSTSTTCIRVTHIRNENCVNAASVSVLCYGQGKHWKQAFEQAKVIRLSYIASTVYYYYYLQLYVVASLTGRWTQDTFIKPPSYMQQRIGYVPLSLYKLKAVYVSHASRSYVLKPPQIWCLAIVHVFDIEIWNYGFLKDHPLFECINCDFFIKPKRSRPYKTEILHFTIFSLIFIIDWLGSTTWMQWCN